MHGPPRRRSDAAFSLVELLVVVSIVAVIAGVVLTQYDSFSHDQMLGTAQVIAADITRARNLAVTNNTSYKITFDRAGNRYTLAHSGPNNALDVLPVSAFHSASGSTTQHTTNLSSLPSGSSGVRLAVVEANDSMMAGFPQQVTDIEFGPFGETTRSLRTTIWLAAGQRKGQRFIGIEIDPITGFASIGRVQTAVPYTLAEEYMNEEMESYYTEFTNSAESNYSETDYSDTYYSDFSDSNYGDTGSLDYSNPMSSELDSSTAY
ncbi:MAG TPA: prepilin-type N-terminal cleavage/methylation domain-containing protein [Pirellulaceae bacterium]|nr:prepilin-type N-terminal cleavage/methylation domain-containing protein [Pirellulaceae bacterium]